MICSKKREDVLESQLDRGQVYRILIFWLKDLSFYNFHGMKLPIVVQLEEFLSPLLGKELLHGVQPDLDSSIDRHRLRHTRPDDACLAVWCGIHEVFVLG